MFKITIAVLAAVAFLGQPAFAQDDPPGSYNDFNYRGNVAALHGEFTTAIRYWSKAIPLDKGGNDRKCWGEGQRVDIAAAKETLARMRSGMLKKSQAAAWYQTRNDALWRYNPCNRP